MRLTDLQGNTERAACRRLRDLAACVEPPQVIVELGSYKGRTACWMASAATTTVFCFDLWDAGAEQQAERIAAGGTDRTNYVDGHFATFERQVAAMGLSDRIVATHGTSTEHAATFGHEVGLLYIDADHRFEAVKADFEAWSPHVPVGGIVAFHDYGNPDFGVRRFVDEHVRTDPAWGEFDVLLWRKRPHRRGLFTARRLA